MIAATPRAAAPTRATWEVIALVAILAGVALAGAVLVATVGQLGFDEALYAAKARSYVDSAPPIDFWPALRPPGLAVLGTVGGLGGFSDASIRSVTVVAGLATLAMVWVVARQLWGPAAGIVALLGAIGAPAFIRELPLFHNDILSVGLLLLLMWLLWDQLEARPAPTPLLVLAAPLAAAAFYARYGNLGAIAAIGFAALLLWGPRLRGHVRLAAVTTLVAVLLLVPHVAESIALTGSPVGIMVSAGEAANTATPLESARQYVRWLPDQLLGWIPLLLAVAGIVHAAIAAVAYAARRTWQGELRRQAWLLIPAVVAGALIVLVSHPERRYLLFPAILLVISGSGAVATAIDRLQASAADERREPVLRRAALAAVAGVLLVWAGYNVFREVDRLVSRDPPRGWAMAGQRIAEDGAGSCRAVSSVEPMLAWYARCRIINMNAQPPLDGSGGEATRTYVVFNDLDPGRASPEALAWYRELAEGATPLPIEDRSRGIEVYRIAP